MRPGIGRNQRYTYMYVVQICWCGVHVPLVQHMLLHQCTCIYSVLVVATCMFCPVACYYLYACIFFKDKSPDCTLSSLIMVIPFRLRSSSFKPLCGSGSVTITLAFFLHSRLFDSTPRFHTGSLLGEETMYWCFSKAQGI